MSRMRVWLLEQGVSEAVMILLALADSDLHGYGIMRSVDSASGDDQARPMQHFWVRKYTVTVIGGLVMIHARDPGRWWVRGVPPLRRREIARTGHGGFVGALASLRATDPVAYNVRYD